MPGATSLGIPYPLQSEPVDNLSWQNLATKVDSLLTSLDAIRSLATDPPSAQIYGGSANAVASATTVAVTAYSTENWDTGGFANLGTFADGLTVPPGLYYVAAFGSFGSVTTFTMARIEIIFAGVTVCGSMIDTNANLSSTLSSTSGFYLATAASTQIKCQVRWVGTGGPPNFTSVALQAMKLRSLADV